jgi:predicted Zn-ribbon and HTH transcriptional regulator
MNMTKTGRKNRRKEFTATIERIVHDRGGGAICGNCGEYLGCDPLNEPDYCPKCGRKLVESGGPPFINPGGSDF